MRCNEATLGQRLLGALVVAGLLAVTSPAWATHVVPTGGDVPTLRPDVGRYLEFINPTEHPGLIGMPCGATPPGAIFTEEHTGYTLADGTDIVEVGDSEVTAGDRADFDWVQEHRSDEFASISNHPGVIGAMGWICDSPEASPHVDPGTAIPHGHVPPLPELDNPPCSGTFDTVDVFSVISIGEDSDVGGPREMALDYDLAFCNSVTGATSAGVPVLVWVPGWTAATGIDDYVARWTAEEPGVYDSVAIEPIVGFDHDGVTEIDAVKVVPKHEIPLLSPLGMIVFCALLLTAMFVMIRRREDATT